MSENPIREDQEVRQDCDPKLRSAIKTTAAAGDLRKLPLIHGSLTFSKTWERIATEGLVASARTSGNSFRWDHALGRRPFVFLQPATVNMSYGMGDIVLVDPMILETPGVCCLLHDPAWPEGWYQLLDRCLMFGKERLKDTIADYIRDEQLAAVILKAAEKVAHTSEVEWPDAMRVALLAADCLPQLYENQLIDPNVFYELLAAECKSCEFSVSDFLNRNESSWGLQEEICVPERVPPIFILGRLTRSKWRPVLEPYHADEDTGLFLSTWRQKYP
jgi:hypothetical protein